MKKAILIAIVVLMLLFMAAYLLLDKEWAKVPFYVALIIECLYNPVCSLLGLGKKKEED